MKLNPFAVASRAAAAVGALTLLWPFADDSVGQTIVNVPPSFVPSSIGGDIVVNLLDGGTINTLTANAGSQINVFGGVGRSIHTAAGARYYMEGGLVEEFSLSGEGEIVGGRLRTMFLGPGSATAIAGGALRSLNVEATALLDLHGVNFQLNGVPITGLDAEGNSVSLNVQAGDVLTGVLADGTAFAQDFNAFSSAARIADGVLSLTRSPEQPASTPEVIEVTSRTSLRSAGKDQTVLVREGGVVEAIFRSSPGSRLEIDGGFIEQDYYAVGTEILMRSGGIGHNFKAYEGTVVNLSGGTVSESRFYRNTTLNVDGGAFVGTLHDGATMNVSGGTIVRVDGHSGSVANIEGGDVMRLATEGVANVRGGSFEQFVINGGTANVYGGVFDDRFFETRSGGQVTLHASSFRLNGSALSNLNNTGDTRLITLGSQDVVSGVFDDGTPFIISRMEGGVLEPIRLTRSIGSAPGPGVINVPTDAAPHGVHSGQTLNLLDGGVLPVNFSAVDGAVVNISGGSVGNNFEVMNARANITGGVTSGIDVFSGGVVDLGGAATSGAISLFTGSTVNVSGGKIGNLYAKAGSTLNISGGESVGLLNAQGARVNISGGKFIEFPQSSSIATASTLSISGGELHKLELHDVSTLTTSGGKIAQLVLGSQTRATIYETEIDRVQANSTSILDIGSGSFSEIDVLGGTVRITGGALGDNQEWLTGVVEVHGFDFRVDGLPLSGLTNVGDQRAFSYAAGTTFTGSLADGSPFLFSPSDAQQSFVTQSSGIRLVQSATPSLPTHIDVPIDAAPFGAAPNQTVVLRDGGVLRGNFVAGEHSTVTIEGGAVGKNFEVYRSTVRISGGTIGPFMDVFVGADVAVSGGVVGQEWEVHSGGEFTVSGGQIQTLGKVRGGVLNVRGHAVVGSSVTATQQSTLNISGGEVGASLIIRGQSVANVSGGAVGANFQIEDGSTANVSGGRLGGMRVRSTGEGVVTGGSFDRFTADSGSTVEIRGGTYGDGFDIRSGAGGAMYGNAFRVNGIDVIGLSADGDQTTVTIATNDLFTGTLSDGTPFAFLSSEGDLPNTLTLRFAAHAQGPAMVDVTTSDAPLGLHQGQELTLHESGSLPDHFNAGIGSTVHINGGSVGNNFEAVGAIVNVAGGTLGQSFDAFAGSRFVVTGGIIGGNFDVHSGATADLRGGVASEIYALPGSNVFLAGAKVGQLTTSNGSKSIWSGGVVDRLTISGTNVLDIVGVDFKINGAAISGLLDEGASIGLTLAAGAVLTGTLADGTPLAYVQDNQSQFPVRSVRLIRSALPPPLTPGVKVVSQGAGPFALGAGQALELNGEGSLVKNFIAGPNSLLRIEGGTVGEGLKVDQAKVRITGGQLGSIVLLAGSDVDIAGGIIPNTGLAIHTGAVVDIFAKQFLLDGQPIAGLANLGDSKVFTERSNRWLSAVLADGSTLAWQLTPMSPSLRGLGISATATLTLHMVPEPSGWALALAGLAGAGAVFSRQRSACA